jgi:hypothetical protein
MQELSLKVTKWFSSCDLKLCIKLFKTFKSFLGSGLLSSAEMKEAGVQVVS